MYVCSELPSRVCSVWPPPWVYLWPRHQLADYKIHLNIDYLDIFSQIFNFYIFFQENKCLLGIYFLVVLALLIGTVYKISFCWFYELKLFQLCILWLTKKKTGAFRCHHLRHSCLQGGLVWQARDTSVQEPQHVWGQPRGERGREDKEGGLQADLEHGPTRRTEKLQIDRIIMIKY